MDAWLTVDSEAMLERLMLIATTNTIDKEKLAHSCQAQSALECVWVCVKRTVWNMNSFPSSQIGTIPRHLRSPYSLR